MIIFLILFFIILSVSFVLAYSSMRDYQEVPASEKEYSLYLIRKPQFLTSQLLGALINLSKGKIISLERLFKGESSALVIFGPRKVLEGHFSEILGLLELEDYTRVTQASSWEIGRRGQPDLKSDFFRDLPAFSKEEQFWWQVVIKDFEVQLRAVFAYADKERGGLVSVLEGIGGKSLGKLPKAFTSDQILDFYRKRVFTPANSYPSKAEEILSFIGLPHK
ncbi:MAG: Uncharacterized protein CEO21_226 [Microgenomates group bacterium Gr01-1014_80]|nr:MAG: Uncharacterized protein CEO21_226 [Microgenomates group bacterium Gr01-1014_80]